MPGPWVSAADNAGFMAARIWREGEIIEAVVYDNQMGDQGRTLWMVQQDGKQDRRGRFVEARLVIAEDEHLNWWLKHGDGSRFKNSFFLHLCKGETGKCKDVNPRRPKEFHTDRLRILDSDDIRLRKAAWWQLSQTKSDFEKFRSEILGDAEPKGAGRGHDDEFDFELSEGENVGGALVEPAEAEDSDGSKEKKRRKSETQLEKDLRDLKKIADKKEAKKARPPAGAKERRDGKKAEKDAAAKDDRDKKKRKAEDVKASDEEPAKAQPSRLWFGKRPGGDDEVKGKGREKKKRRDSSSDSSSSSRKRKKKKLRKKKKKAKRKDRGPYGIGQKVDFEENNASSASSSSEESVFRGGAPKERSQQLQLMEYAMLNPGRLTSRLLLKMQNLLAKEGAPINQERPGNMTPATATAYLLTILIPTHRERLGVRLLREMRTIAGSIDEIARGNPEAAGDVLSQRLKALELQLVDNSWQRAQFLELIPQEGAGLSERSEQAMAAREQMQDMKIRAWSQDSWNKGSLKGGGGEKGKGKGKKGKKGAKNAEGTWGANPETKPPNA